MSRRWRDIVGAELLAFVRGKTVATLEVDGSGGTTIFTDGSAIRVSAVDGAQYSTLSGDSATVEWEASDRP